MTGRKLAHYEVSELIGKGGMGEVYRALDTKLDRQVALKILPTEFSSDSDRMARFQREAKTLASLHHPNIASIFGFESDDDCTFLVMELVEGEDLAEVLKHGALPVDEAVDIARQVAEGLEEAHEIGIVHRDLKPANVKRTPDGKVKILDFGLARAFAGKTAAEEQVSSAMTMTAPMTQLGMVLGTAAYMSPEQARGKDVDRRADIWAFGVILFEMLTGKRLFDGETASDTLAGILKSEPGWDLLPSELPLQVDRVLRRCLAKDPRQRLRDIGEARVRLEDPEAESGLFTGAVQAVAAGPRPGKTGRIAPWVLLVLALAVVGWLIVERQVQPEPQPLHVAIPAPKDHDYHITGSFPGLPEISPDGKRLAFSALSQEENGVQLFVRSLHAEKPIALSDTKDAQYPFWSPDSQWIAYYVRTQGLLKVPVNGGPPQLVAAATNGKGGTWNQFGDILFTTDYNSPISMVKDTGGEVRLVTDLENDEGFNSHRHPHFLPDGKHFLYYARGAGKIDSQIRFASLDGAETKVVVNAPAMGYYASGYLLYLVHGDLVAQPMNPETGDLSDSPTPIVESVLNVAGAAKSAFSVSANGTLSYLSGEVAMEGTISWRNRHGIMTEEIGDFAPYDMVRLAPDERSAAVGLVGLQAGTWDIWLMDLNRNFRTRFTFDPADDFDLVFTEDSRAVYFASDREGVADIYKKEIGSPDAPEKIFGRDEYLRLWDMTDDGNTLIYSNAGNGTAWDLFAVDLDDPDNPRPLRVTPDSDVLAQLSPDEKWMLFASAESGEFQVYVAPWPAMSPITQVSTNSGTWSKWTKDGREVILQEMSGQMVACSMAVEDSRMIIGIPEPLFQFTTPQLESMHWDVSSDGEDFLTVNTFQSTVPGHCNLVLNWPQLLKTR